MTPGKVTELISEAKTALVSVLWTLYALRTAILMWGAYAATIAGVFRLITNNNAWLGEAWLGLATVLIIARWLVIHDEQIAKLTVVSTAEQLFRTAVVAHQQRMENELKELRARLDDHGIRSTTAVVRPPQRPTPYKRTEQRP
jgi:hypothetical protein